MGMQNRVSECEHENDSGGGEARRKKEEEANMTSKRSLKSEECSGGVTMRSAIMPCNVRRVTCDVCCVTCDVYV